jgi:GT2 family glycosyltransferase
MSQFPEISVIVVVSDSLPALTACLEALAASAVADRCEVIGVANASTDQSAAEFERLVPGVVVIRNAANVGFARACNQGAAVAGGEYLLFLNPDTRVDADAVATLWQAARQDARAGLVSGRLRFPDGRFQPTCRELPTLGNMLFSRGSLVSRFGGGKAGSRQQYTLSDSDRTAEVPAVAATMVMIKRAVFEQVGGFDPRFFLFMEDTDLSLRLREAGYHNLYVPAAGAVHLWGEGSRVGRGNRLRHHHCSVWKYFCKHRPGAVSYLLLPMALLVNFVLTLLVPAREGRR